MPGGQPGRDARQPAASPRVGRFCRPSRARGVGHHVEVGLWYGRLFSNVVQAALQVGRLLSRDLSKDTRNLDDCYPVPGIV